MNRWVSIALKFGERGLGLAPELAINAEGRQQVAEIDQRLLHLGDLQPIRTVLDRRRARADVAELLVAIEPGRVILGALGRGVVALAGFEAPYGRSRGGRTPADQVGGRFTVDDPGRDRIRMCFVRIVAMRPVSGVALDRGSVLDVQRRYVRRRDTEDGIRRSTIFPGDARRAGSGAGAPPAPDHNRVDSHRALAGLVRFCAASTGTA